MAKGAAKRKPTIPQDKVEVFQKFEQGTDEWRRIRAGIPTASRFADVIAGGDGKMRTRYMNELCAELVTGEPMEEGYQSADMLRGKQLEPEVRDWYVRTHFADFAAVAFVRRTILTPVGSFVVGCSPDCMIGREGALEIKTLRRDLLIAARKRGAAAATEHRPQCQGVLLVTGRQWVDLVLWAHPKLPKLKFRVERDEHYLRKDCGTGKGLVDELERFDYGLRQLVAEVKREATT